jgi:hypothetical protein
LPKPCPTGKRFTQLDPILSIPQQLCLHTNTALKLSCEFLIEFEKKIWYKILSILNQNIGKYMKFISFLFTLFLLATGVQLQAEPNSLEKYIITLECIDFQPDCTNFHLSNGTVYSSTLLPCENELLQQWKAGTAIDMSVHEEVRIKSLSLIDLGSKILYFPQVTLKFFENLPTIEKIEKARNLKYPSIKFFDCYLLLSDGSYWTTYYFDDFQSWKVGDHINISYVVNHDAQDDKDSSKVTMINYDRIQARDFDSSYHFFKPASEVSEESYLTIQKIEKRKEYVWSSYFTVFLTLSDKSRWKTTLSDKEDEEKLERWFEGDKVILPKLVDDVLSIANYSIISTDIEADAAVYFNRIK